MVIWVGEMYVVKLVVDEMALIPEASVAQEGDHACITSAGRID